MEEPPAAQCSNHGFQTHNKGCGSGFHMSLPNNLEGVSNTHGENTCIANGQCTGKDVSHINCFQTKHEGNGNDGNHQSLNAVQPQTVTIPCKVIDTGNLHCVGKSRTDYEKITLVDFRDTNTAEQV